MQKIKSLSDFFTKKKSFMETNFNKQVSIQSNPWDFNVH